MQYTTCMDTRAKRTISFWLWPFVCTVFVIFVFVFSFRAEPGTSAGVSVPEKETATDAVPLDTFSIPILVYHNIREYTPNESVANRDYVVTPAEFAKQMKYLQDEGYTTLLVRELESILNGTMELPERPVAVVFDDGKISQYENALPVLRAHTIRATFYIFTNAIDANDGYLNSDQIRELDAEGFEIASHTILHPYLTRIDHERLVKELVESKSKLERIVGHEVTSLAYPFGLYDDIVLAEVARAGYTSARGLSHAYEVSQEHLLALPGFIVTNDYSYFQAIVKGTAR
jgi:peptidoglycan/xylan/chitin deacetylase (PgdA/CDA1 family)